MRRYIAAGLVLAAVCIAGVWARAQAQTPSAPEPTIITGGDVGFRIDRWQGDTPIGRWVIRHDGKWVEPRTSAGTHRVITR
jgi:hypothetical protein